MAGGDSKNVGVFLPLRTDFCTCCVYWSRIVRVCHSMWILACPLLKPVYAYGVRIAHW